MKKPLPIPDGQITPAEVYFNRRNFLRVGLTAASVAATATLYRRLNPVGTTEVNTAEIAGLAPEQDPVAAAARGFIVDEPKTPLKSIAGYNNFYEFTTDKESVATAAKGFVSRPWKVMVDGLVHKPTEFDLDDLLKIAPPEERVYRMRCVEAWSMVIPWVGFPLSKLLARVEPTGAAKYVAFQTLLDPARFPGQKGAALDWPYVEGLRLDEAMHPLTILASGIYGRELPAQNGAPLRLVVPWKYGFKGIKSIVRITLTDTQPKATWNITNPQEYGFYSNVNPQVDHPRWSQADEQRIGESGRRKTLMFNGYEEQVASLYTGMDLRANY